MIQSVFLSLPHNKLGSSYNSERMRMEPSTTTDSIKFSDEIHVECSQGQLQTTTLDDAAMLNFQTCCKISYSDFLYIYLPPLFHPIFRATVLVLIPLFCRMINRHNTNVIQTLPKLHHHPYTFPPRFQNPISHPTRPTDP